MASEGFFSISVASVLKEHGKRLSDMDLASRKAEEADARRYEVASWLRKTVGVVSAKDLPEEPSEEEFRLGLRSGLILCNALNKVQPAAIPKIVASSGDSVVIPDGAALSAYQYFENVRNFLVAVQEIGLPTFEVSDLEQGEKSSRIVNCVLALKSYSEWRQIGGGGSWKFGENAKFAVSGKAFMRKNFDPFSNSLVRSQSVDDRESFCTEQNLNQVESSEKAPSPSLNMLVHEILSDKKPEEVPALVESMLNKLMKEFGCRIASQNELVKTTIKGLQDDGKSFSKLKIPADPSPISEFKKEKEVIKCTRLKENCHNNMKQEEASKEQLLKKYSILDRQQRNIQFLRHDLQTARAGMEFMHMKYLQELQMIGKHMHSLVNAASGYHKVLAENRKLYNQVQDLKVEVGAARLNKESGEAKELRKQVGTLKAALAKTKGEAGHFQSIVPTDPSTLKTRASSSAHLNKRHGGDFLSFQNENHRQPMEDVGNIEVRSNPTSDSSEADALWQFNLPNSTCGSNSGGSMIRKRLIKPANSQDFS